MEDSSFFIYVGYSDQPIAGHKPPWQFIPHTSETLQQAIQDGYTAISTMSFEYAPEKGKPEPIRRGSLFLDFDNKNDPSRAITAARKFVELLERKLFIPPARLKYWLSGGKGCHLEVPSSLYGGEGGDPYLPFVHRLMVFLLSRRIARSAGLDIALDMQLYCMGKGKLLRLPNIRRPNGRFKVPVSSTEFLNLEYSELEALTLNPRLDFVSEQESPFYSKLLSELYSLVLQCIRSGCNKPNPSAGLEALLSCTFMEHCYEDQVSLVEPHWWVMINILKSFGRVGHELIHEFSRDHPGYSHEKTEKKIQDNQGKSAHITCGYIQSGLNFNCGKQCGVNSPADLWRHKKSHDVKAASHFVQKPDGVYYITDENDSGLRICTPIQVVAKMRNPDGKGWARLIELQAPDGSKKQLCLPMKEFGGRGDAIRGALLDSGVEISSHPKAFQFLVEYLTSSAPDDAFWTLVNKIGWISDASYVLPDMQFGKNNSEKIYFQCEAESLHNCSGTLEEWQQHVGEYCRGNPLLILSVSYALTGPLLKIFNMEGGGLHVFGKSSSGKSTSAIVAGSVCGGGGHRGYLRQWRATHNALENTATMHNDNLLILDEISQASSDTVSQAAFMLANGQGKERLKSDASKRPQYTWRLNFLSTGELTMNDKIEENGKYKTLTGQTVRVIDLPIDSGTGANAFNDFHGLEDSQKLSDTLTRNAAQYYGAPLRTFLSEFCGENKEGYINALRKNMEQFSAANCPAGASGQVQRVLSKFALIASVGELAASFGIFPFAAQEAQAAAAYWFSVWLNQRNGIGDRETMLVLKRIQDHFAQYSQRYMQINTFDTYSPFNLLGYTWEEKGVRHYLTISQVLEELFKGVNRRTIMSEIDKKGWLAHTSRGSIMETKSIHGRTVRGLVFIPSVWENEK